MPFRPMAQHSHFLLAKRVMVMFMGPEAYAQSPEAYILLVDKATQWQWASPQAKAIFNPLTVIFTKCFSFCFNVISLTLQDLNFVRK